MKIGKNMEKKHKKGQEQKNNLKEREQKNVADKKKQKNLLMTVFAVAVGIIVFVLLLWKLSGILDEPSKTKAFQVGEEMVYMDEVHFCILQNVVSLGIGSEELQATAKDGSSADEYYKQEIMNMIMDYKVEAIAAKKQGLSLSEEEEREVKNDVASYMKAFDGHVFRELGITQELIADICKDRYLAHKLRQTITEDLEVEEVTYATIYMLLFPKIEMDDSGDYVKEEGGDNPIMLSDAEIEQQKADAQAAYEELESGADIEEIAKKYGVQNYSGEQSNTPESFGESFGEDFSKYTKTLKADEISPVIDAGSCYAVIKMITPDNEEIAEQIKEYYRNDLEDETIEENKIKWYEAAGASTEPKWVGNAWKQVTLYDFVKYVEE
ncbi:MAG: peptidylprolyl isomerase [Lachnospiraceae bacterium]|nr:peptidylprolyl isomerase [Lachnospiraceae bacterium]